jgi:hypothetical protein
VAHIQPSKRHRRNFVIVVQDGSRRHAAVGTVIALSYLLGLVGTFADPSKIYREIAHPLLKYMSEPVAFLLLSPLLGFCWLFPAIAGTMAFNWWGGSFLRTRLTLSSLMMAGLYLGGNSWHFAGEQWIWLHLYMCGQLIVLGYTFPKIQITNWIAFGLLVLAYVSHARISTWETLDYLWGLYFVFAAFAPWALRIELGASNC